MSRSRRSGCQTLRGPMRAFRRRFDLPRRLRMKRVQPREVAERLPDPIEWGGEALPCGRAAGPDPRTDA